MTLCRWKKYNLNKRTEKTYYMSFGEPIDFYEYNHISVPGRAGYIINQSTGKAELTGAYIDSSTTATRYTLGNNGGVTKFYLIGYATHKSEGTIRSSSKTVYSEGEYIDTVVAEENTYPLDGKSGDYWYVRDVQLGLCLNNDSAVKMAKEVYYNDNGTIKTVREAHYNDNGEVKRLL
ncbi:MAG: hypothetical protein GXZ11_05590 [Tissierellia bacterium]|nr:hypothetical protein [Tissierellia bacterium]